MTITAEQRELRRKWVGASDVAAICGLDQYRTQYDVWMEKVYGTDDTASKPAELGNILEDALLDWAERELGSGGVKRGLRFEHPDNPMAAHPDGVVIYADGPRVVEAKTAGLMRPGFWPADEGWDGDTVPDRVLIQVHAQMMCVGDDCHTGYVAALVAGLGLKLYTIERNEDYCHGIARRVERFWSLVEKGTPPEQSTPTLDVVRRVRRVPGKSVDIPDDLVAAYTSANLARKQQKKREDEAKARMLAALGDAEAGVYEQDGERWMVTNYADKRGARRLNITKIGDVL